MLERTLNYPGPQYSFGALPRPTQNFTSTAIFTCHCLLLGWNAQPCSDRRALGKCHRLLEGCESCQDSRFMLSMQQNHWSQEKSSHLSHLPIIEASGGLLLQCKRALDLIVGLPKHKNLGRHSSLSLTNPEHKVNEMPCSMYPCQTIL